MPRGLIDREQRNPLNFTLEQWQKARRLKDDPRRIKQALQECWATSDGRKAYEAALERKGYYLARGDRRGYVAMDWRGEVYSLSRWTNVKAKELKARLGPAKELPSVDETRAHLDRKLVDRFETLTRQINEKHDRETRALALMRRNLAEKHRQERAELRKKQAVRQVEEGKRAQARFRKGFLGWWDRVSGQHARIRGENERNAWRSARHDQTERDRLIHAQIEVRTGLQKRIDATAKSRNMEIDRIQRRVVDNLPESKLDRLSQRLKTSRSHSRHGLTL